MDLTDTCIICGKDDESPKNVVGEKGLQSIKRTCKQKGETDLQNKLDQRLASESKIVVHVACRKRFTDPRSIEHAVPSKKLRSSIDHVFNWKDDCFLCDKPCDKRRGKFIEVMTLALRDTVIACAHNRTDDWGKKVLARMEGCIDLVAEEAVYHSRCMADFRLNDDVQNSSVGRPADKDMVEAYEKFCYHFENTMDCEIYSIQELHEKMLEFNKNGYSLRSFREKLKNRYKDYIYFVKGEGRQSDLVCFKNMADYHLREMKSSTKESVLKAAAKIIKAEIRDLNVTKTHYPNAEDIMDEIKGRKWIPESLSMFMSQLVSSNVKQMCISQCIVQAARPRTVITPILFGLGVQLDKTFGSKWLVNHLSKLGLAISPDEVTKFKQSVIENIDEVNQESEIDLATLTRLFAQWTADNVDHNTATLSGKGTFHGMGIICTSDKPLQGHFGHVPRLRKRIKAEKLIEKKGIDIIQYYKHSDTGLKKLSLSPYKQLLSVPTIPSATNYDTIWHFGWFCHTTNKSRPNWTGYMQCATGATPETKTKSTVQFLPIIDLSPSSETCIYSTLRFIIEEAKKAGIQTPCVTFDQPLWLKAMGIIKEEALPIVCRLGGFHTLMSFLGSIGTLMKGSGLDDLLEEIYAENSIPQMMSGKAIARALRAFMSVQSALMTLIIENIKEENDDLPELTELQEFHNSILDGNHDDDTFETVTSSEGYRKLTKMIQDLETKLAAKSRTSKLWLMFMEYVDIVKMFIFAERTSDWELHLLTVTNMLNLFAATGHIHYAKSARLYVQEMRKLPETHPWLYQQFMEEQHTVKRTDKNFTGLWTDLTIEQTLMRTIKSRGGLTQGRGMTESVRHQWVLTLNHMASIHDAMMQLSKAQITSSEQHAELGASRRKRDHADCEKLLSWLTTKNPFMVPDSNLLSLSSGLVSVSGKDSVNCDQAEEIGRRIQNGLDGSNITNASIKRKDAIKPLQSLTEENNKTKNEVSGIDPKVMFTRMVVVAEREDSLEPFFEYELTTEPMSLFKEGMMRKPDKPSLRKALLPDSTSKSSDVIDKKVTSIIDGGAFLHRVLWKKGMKFSEVGKSYVNYIKNHYHHAVVVFDGYDDESTKSHEHLRRNSVPQSKFVKINPDNPVPYVQERYFSSIENKAEFIIFISNLLRESNIEVHNCTGDADSFIVEKALEHASRQPRRTVNVVADDTDIVIMLLHHWKPNKYADIYFVQERYNKAWSIEQANPSIDDIKDDLLFLHAWTGCDTTSNIFNKGKSSLVTTIRKSRRLREMSTTISNVWSTQEEVGQASIEAFKILYGGKKDSTLSRLRHGKYIEMACKGIIEPEKLPPTERAAYFHGLRAHYQIMCWSLLGDDFFEFDVREWGWRNKNNEYLIPIMTDQSIAPESLTKVIRCKCKTTTKNPCGTKTCTCRKYGLACVSSCGECYGVDCNNTDDDYVAPDEDEELEPQNEKDNEDEGNIFDKLANSDC